MSIDKSILKICGLNVYYGQAHAVQDVNISLKKGVMSVVGRNGMGKTSLCNAIAGMTRFDGSILFYGEEINGIHQHRLALMGIGYVPQGRRIWQSLSVHEHLLLASKSARGGDWNLERIYDIFPRIAERKKSGGSQLSGGEQQMLAISRALLLNPSLLIMDEPTEGLSPVMVEVVVKMLKSLVAEGKISVFLIEQNIGVAIDVADSVGVMVNGQITKILPAKKLATNRILIQELLGLKNANSNVLSLKKKQKKLQKI